MPCYDDNYKTATPEEPTEARELDLVVATTAEGGRVKMILTAGPDTLTIIAKPSVAASFAGTVAKALAELATASGGR